MFELEYYQCPGCKAEIQGKIEDGAQLDCLYCRRQFRVMVEQESGKVGFVEVVEKELPEPLYLPRGSIRATVTILVAMSSWILFVAGRDVPGYLLSLLLAVIGYYFAFRRGMRASQSRIFDVSAKLQEPLFMPAGLIRGLLIAGFALSGVLVYFRDRLADPKYLEFFVVLLGLVLGYIFAKLFARASRTPFYIFINHVKGAAVLAAALSLAVLVIRPAGPGGEHAALLLACIISFYFGSRS